jgi:hypothetical protein
MPMGARRKSDDINGNYPLLGFRVTKDEKDSFIKEFEMALSILSSQPEYRRINLKKNAVFLRALELGLEQIKKKKSLG